MNRTEIKIGRLRYVLQERNDNRGGLQITRTAPYDETECHWALSRIPGNWTILRKGEVVARVLDEDPLEVAEVCKQYDDKCGLHRTGGIY